MGGFAMFKKTILVAVLFLTAVVFCGCQTVEGLGRDIQWTGEHLSGAASTD